MIPDGIASRINGEGIPRMSGGDLKNNDISNIIAPEKANDIGERLILFPKHLNA